MSIGWEIGIEGEEGVAIALRASADKAENTKLIMGRIVLDLMRIEEILFHSGGRRGGGSWANLKPSTVKKKGTTEILVTANAKPNYSKIGGSPSRNTLVNSLTKPGAPYQILQVGDSSFTFGTDRPQAARIDASRPFLQVTPGDVSRWTNWMVEHLMSPFVGGTNE